jgi:hypothetical protein
MTALRDPLAAALQKHQPVDDGEGFFCSCSSTAVLLEQGIATDYTPQHLADVLLALDDIAIVELPSATGDLLLGGMEWRFGLTFCPRLVVWTAPESPVMIQNVEPGDLAPDQARALAAALLAAASAAEKQP